MSGLAVTLVDSGGLPVRGVESGAPLMTVVDSGGIAVTVGEYGPAFVIEGGVVPTTLDPAQKGPSITLSNGDLTLTSTGGWNNVRGTQSRSSGKYYWEVTPSAGDGGIGVSNASGNLASYLGATANSLGYTNDGTIYPTFDSSPGAYVGGNVIGVAVNLDTDKIWFAKNGAWTGNPVAGTGGSTIAPLGADVFPAVASVNNPLTVNFGSTPFAHAAPTGFKAWDS